MRTKLVLLFALVMSVFCSFAVLYFPANHKKLVVESFAEKSNGTAAIAAQVLNVALTTSPNHLDTVVASIHRQNGMKFFVFANDSGNVIAAFNLANAELQSYYLLSKDVSLDSAFYKVSSPVFKKGKRAGICYLGFSLEKINRDIKDYQAFVEVICFGIFVSGIMLMFLISTMVISPIKDITEVAERAAKGDLHSRATSRYNDETGRLATAVNTLLLNVDSTLKKVTSLTQVLDKRDRQLEEEVEKRAVIEKQVQLTNEIINKVSALILVANSTGGIEYASPSFEHVLGYKPEDLLDDGWWKVSRTDLAERMKERNMVAKCARREHRISVIPYERQIIDVQGKPRWILWQDTLGLNSTLIGVGQDITERKMAEEQIREQAALLDITGDAILVRNLDHRILYWNRGAEKLYGVESQSAVDKDARELFQEESVEGIGVAYTGVIENGSWNGELKQTTLTGKKIIVESRWTLMNDNKDKPKSILVVNTDVTEQRQLETQFRRAQRLENIGTLAGGIAHDLNNVLTPILMSIQGLQKRHADEKTQQVLSTIALSARRGADIVKQVLTFARGSEGERMLLQLKHILREVEQITKETFPKSIKLCFDIPTRLWTITGDATQLHQIFLNLMVNARDAMPEGGKLTLSAQNVSLDEDGAKIHIHAKPGNYVVLSVQDTGTGIPQDILDKIFDPFFTTKEVGKGTGLGLSTVMTIVKSYGGFIVVNSTIGQGTEFRVYIPATNVDSIQQQDETKRHLPTGRGESILVVDDEVSIREITKETLEAYGYHIQTAKDGIEALTAIEKSRNKFSVVLTDMMMPNMDGASLIRTVERLAPDIKIIAVSGMTDTETLAKIKKSRVEAFLPKPIQTDNLLRILDSVLHEDEEGKNGKKAKKT